MNFNKVCNGIRFVFLFAEQGYGFYNAIKKDTLCVPKQGWILIETRVDYGPCKNFNFF